MKLQYNLIVLSFLLVTQICCSYPTKQIQIYLQQDEQYTLELDNYYSFPAQNFTWPSNISSDQEKSPFTLFENSASAGNIFEILSTFSVGDSSKYYIGFQRITMENSNITDIVLSYYQLQIDDQTGILSRTSLVQIDLVSNVTSKFKMEASFYNQGSGFITYSDSQVREGLIHFEYITNGGRKLNMTKLNDQYISKHASRELLASSSIYLVSVQDKTLHLLLQKYNKEQNTLDIVDSTQSSFSVKRFIFTEQFMIYVQYPCYDIFQINYQSQQLMRNNIDLFQVTALTKYSTVLSFQLINQLAIISYQNEFSEITHFTRFSVTRNYNQGDLEYIDEYEIPYLISKPKFIDENHFVVAQSTSLILINFQERKIIFSKQFDSSDQIVLEEFIGNQFFFFQQKNSLYYATPFKVQNPSISLIGSSSTKYSILISQSDSNFGINLEISVNITNELIQTSVANPALLWNIISQYEQTTTFSPIEEYVTGLNLDSGIKYEGDSLKEVRLTRITEPTVYQTKLPQYKIKKVYETDGKYSQFLVIKQVVQYCTTINAVTTDGEYQLHVATQVQESPIFFIDNFGSFALLPSALEPDIDIYIPSQDDQFQIFRLQGIVQCGKKIKFASDPLNNVIFILCNSKIQYVQYQIPYDRNIGAYEPAILNILSTEELDYDFTNFKSLICIRGRLFVYNDSSIVSFNYFQNVFGKNVIQIPQLSTQNKQVIILFSQSFIIIPQESSIQTIAEYSYGDFENSDPTYLRNFYIDANYPINPINLDLFYIAKRNDVEYLFLRTSNDNTQYLIYRIGQQYYSQNQLFSIAYRYANETSTPLLSTSAVCHMSNTEVSCQDILKQASISYQLNFNQTQFYENLSFDNPVTIHSQDQQQMFDLKIVRNASASLGVVNTNSEQIQNLRAQIQDNNFTKNTIFRFNDSKVYSSCLLNWQTDNPIVEIQQRLSLKGSDWRKNQTFEVIMFTQKIMVGDGTITLVSEDRIIFQNSNINKNCYAYDDQASRKNVSDQQFTIDVYILCDSESQKFIVLNMQFSINTLSDNTQNLKFVSSELKKIEDVVDSTILHTIDKIISYENQLWLYDTVNSLRYNIQSNEKTQTIEIVPNLDLSLPISMNVLNNNQFQLNFYQSGVINIVIRRDSNNIQYSSSNLIELIEQQGFSILNQIIASVQQLSDNLFRIQFKDYFIFEMEFELDSQNILVIQNVYLFYYRDVFEKQILSVRGESNYTAIIGLDEDGKSIQILLFNYLHEKHRQLLIEFAEMPMYELYYKLTYAEFISANQFKIYYFNGYFQTITILEEVGINFWMERSYFEGSNIQIFPSKNDQTGFQLSISKIQPSDDPKSTSSFLMSLKPFMFIKIILTLITLI